MEERESVCVCMDSILDKEKVKEEQRGREGQFGLRISVKGTRREGNNK